MFLDGSEDLFGMTLWLDLGKDLQKLLVRADEECRALDADDLFAVHVLFFQHIKLLADDFVHVGEQGIGQLVLFPEFFL